MFWGTGNRGNGESYFGRLLQILRSKIEKNMVIPHKTPIRKSTYPFLSLQTRQ